jgi:membrane-associated phospholipid phosphatase
MYSADSDGIPRSRGLRGGAWLSCAVFSIATAVLLLATRTNMALSSIEGAAASVLAGSLLYLRYTVLRPDQRLSTVIGGLTLMLWAGFAAGTTALAALRTGAPLIDADLARADALLGVHTPSLIAWLTAHHTMPILALAYRGTVPLIFAAVVLLGVMRREAAVWELCLSFTVCAAICTLVSSIVPAAGTFVHYTIPSDVIAALPQKAGSYYLQVFDAYRSGAADTIDIGHFEGVVQFPSFHTCMALMLAYSLRSIRWLFPPACVWSGLTILATMPMGGHYFSDVVAGACVWTLCILPYPRLLTWSLGSGLASVRAS